MVEEVCRAGAIVRVFKLAARAHSRASLTQPLTLKELGCEEKHCFVIFRESPTEHNFYVGDGFLNPFNPAAHSKL